MTTIAWFHCFAGIAGDMTLGSLIDAGADPHEVLELLNRIPVSGWALEATPVLRCGIGATHVVIHAEDTTVVRTHAHIVGLIEEARLPDRVRDRSLRVFDALAAAEGAVHRKPPSQVHFHEVGGLDAIVDVVGSCAALELLDVDEVAASPIATGLGMVRSAHGMLPNPAPAVVELLRDIPTYGRDVSVELTTPTGAAIVAGLASSFGPMPSLRIRSVGYGAGTSDMDGLPNVTQVVVGTAGESNRPGQPVVLIEANVDDATGETLAHALAELLAAGAHDAWLTPIIMKKGRPAHTVSALADPSLVEQVAGILTAETGTLGVRSTTIERWPATRRLDAVDVAGFPVRVKVGAGRVKVEHDDAARAARSTGIPLREVVSLAEEAFRRRGVDDLGGPDSPEG